MCRRPLVANAYLCTILMQALAVGPVPLAPLALTTGEVTSGPAPAAHLDSRLQRLRHPDRTSASALRELVAAHASCASPAPGELL
jgi:hypothetical protein